MSTEQAINSARNIQLFVMDVDGVLSDGKLYFGNSGEEIKNFNIQDGLGIKLLRDAGVITAIITGRSSEIVKKRASNLGIEHLVQGREDKLVALQALCEELSMPMENVAYIGDDLPDLSAIRAAGLGMTVANCYALVAEHADWQSRFNGGDGAVREASDFILSAKGILTKAHAEFL